MSSPTADGEPSIWVLGVEDTTDRALMPALDARYERGKVSVAELRNRLGEFLDSMQSVLEPLPNALGAFNVDSVALKLEITAKGKVSLLGTGGELGGTGGVTITLKRASGASAS
jgi:hypothetical protein